MPPQWAKDTPGAFPIRQLTVLGILHAHQPHERNPHS